MKKIFIVCSALLIFFVVGCQKNGEKDIINDLSKKVNKKYERDKSKYFEL